MTPFWRDALLNSLLVVGGVSLLSLIIALPSAWLLERTDIRGKRFFDHAFSLPYVVPSYLLAISWITLANPSVGWINHLSRRFLNGTNVVNIYNLGGIIFIEASALFAILFLAFRSGLRRMDPALEEAARLSGASSLRIFFQITCPLLKNTIFSSLIAIALASLASFGVPAMIGGPARLYVLTTGIFSLLRQGSFEAQNQSLWIAIEMGLAALVLVGISRFFSKQQLSLVSGKSSRPALVRLGALKPFAQWALTLSWILLAALPIFTLVLSSFQSNPGSLAWESFNLNAWKYVWFTLPDFHRGVQNSVIVSFAAAAIVLVLTIPLSLMAWQSYHAKKRGMGIFVRIIEDASLLLYSLPGTVLAVLLIFFAAKFSFLELSDSLSLIVLALVVKYLALGFRTLNPATFLIHPSLIEAARLSGAGFFARVFRIWLPLLRPTLIAVALLVLMPCIGELTMSILLYGPGTETLGVNLFQLQEYADRAAASVVGTFLLVAVMAFQLLSGRLLREH